VIGAATLSVAACMLGGVEMPIDLIVHYQAGVVSRAQAREAGLSEGGIRHRVATGRWQRVYPGVYATFSGPLPNQARLWAAVLYAGPGAVLSHETAAEFQRLIDEPAPLIHLTVPAARQAVPRQGLVIHRARRVLGDRGFPLGVLPQTLVDDTLLDLIDQADAFDEVCALVTRAFGRKLTSEGRLRATIGLRKRLRWRTDVDALITEAARGTHSRLEHHYDRDVEGAHGLPRSARQTPYTKPDGGKGFRDRVYRQFRVVVELDGASAHPEENRWADRERDNHAATLRQQTLRFGWKHVRHHTCDTAAITATVLKNHGWLGSPKQCSPACEITKRLAR
jgi:Transcriptional regulator, AbiEi antitoxin